MKRVVASGIVLGLGLGTSIMLPAQSYAVTFYEWNRISLTSSGLDLIGTNPTQLGGNPSSITIDGSTVYVGASGSTGRIAQILNALSTPGVGAVFGAGTGGTSSGWTGLDLQGGQLVGVESNGGTPRLRSFTVGSIVNGYAGDWTALPATFAGTSGQNRWDGIAFDPGFGGSGGGVAGMARGAGRRMLANAADGSVIYSNSGGADPGFIYSTSETTVRDVDFDPDNGDIFVRTEAGVWRGNRTGVNSIVRPSDSAAGAEKIVTLTQNTAANNNLKLLDNLGGTTDYIILNDKSGTLGTTNPFASVVKLFTSSGAIEPAIFLNATGSLPFTPATGSSTQTGIFDFAWDSATETLAISDFSNNQIYLFRTGVIPEPTTFALLALSSGIVMLRRKRA